MNQAPNSSRSTAPLDTRSGDQSTSSTHSNTVVHSQETSTATLSTETTAQHAVNNLPIQFTSIGSILGKKVESFANCQTRIEEELAAREQMRKDARDDIAVRENKKLELAQTARAVDREVRVRLQPRLTRLQEDYDAEVRRVSEEETRLANRTKEQIAEEMAALTAEAEGIKNQLAHLSALEHAEMEETRTALAQMDEAKNHFASNLLVTSSTPSAAPTRIVDQVQVTLDTKANVSSKSTDGNVTGSGASNTQVSTTVKSTPITPPVVPAVVLTPPPAASTAASTSKVATTDNRGAANISNPPQGAGKTDTGAKAAEKSCCQSIFYCYTYASTAKKITTKEEETKVKEETVKKSTTQGVALNE